MLSVQLVDLTAERLAQVDLEHERDFTAAVLDTTNTLIVVLDQHGSIVRFNPAAEKVSGLAPRTSRCAGRQVCGVGSATCSTPGSEPATPDLRRARTVGRTSGRSAVRHRAHGAWSCAYLDADDSRPRTLVLTGIDVTDERLAQRLVDQVLAATTGTSIIGTDPAGHHHVLQPRRRAAAGLDRRRGRGQGDTRGLPRPRRDASTRGDELGLDAGFGVLVAGVDGRGRPEKRDWNYVRKDGRKITMSLTVSPMTSPSGRVVGYLGVAEDVTERRRVEDLLRVALAKEREAVERLNEVDRAKTDFVSTVSHELRTPITSVLGYTQMLQRGSGGGLTERQATAARPGREQRPAAAGPHRGPADAVADRGRHLRTSRVARSTCARWCCAAVRGDRDAARTTATSSWVVEPGDAPVVVSGDEDQLERAVINLLTNAVKFTPDGGRVRRGADDGRRVARCC